MLLTLHLQHRLMNVGIEIPTHRLDLLHTMFLQTAQKLSLKHFEPFSKGIEVIGVAGMFHRPVHVVDERQDVPEQIFIAISDRIALFPDGPFFIIIQFGCGTHIFVVIFRRLLFHFLKFHYQILF
jgi:hypothetical protein